MLKLSALEGGYISNPSEQETVGENLAASLWQPGVSSVSAYVGHLAQYPGKEEGKEETGAASSFSQDLSIIAGR